MSETAEKINAALTAEEWEDVEAAEAVVGRVASERRLSFALEQTEDYGAVEYSRTATPDEEAAALLTAPVKEALHIYDGGNLAVYVFSPQRHTLAALALHGQPFGFTREDVKKLREAGDKSEDGEASGDYYLGGMMETLDPAWCRSLADRIAALLPPEG